MGCFVSNARRKGSNTSSASDCSSVCPAIDIVAAAEAPIFKFEAASLGLLEDVGLVGVEQISLLSIEDCSTSDKLESVTELDFNKINLQSETCKYHDIISNLTNP